MPKKPIPKPRGDKYLWMCYSHFNKVYFGNKLPTPMVLYFGGTKADGDMQFMESGTVRIRIHEDLKRHLDMAAIALLHEMIHVHLGYDYKGEHGMRFESEKVRLFMAGAYDKVL